MRRSGEAPQVPQQVQLTGLSALEHGQALTFDYERRGESEQGFVLRHNDGYVAYRNWCPHWGVDLDMGGGRFYAPKVDRIYCRNHGALFRPKDGFCDAGPCAMAHLEAFEIEVDGDAATVTIADIDPRLLG